MLPFGLVHLGYPERTEGGTTQTVVSAVRQEASEVDQQSSGAAEGF